MSVTSGFHNSSNGDRKYDARQMSSIFSGIINDGVFANIGTAFAVKAATGNTVNVGIGKAWFNDGWLLNDAILPITLPDADLLLNRYDAIVLEFNNTDAVRKHTIKVLSGTAATTPTKPVLTKAGDIHQYPLVYIYRTKASTAITQADITNCIGTSACPYITGILQVVSNDNVVSQWEAQWAQWTAKESAEWTKWMTDEKTEFDSWKTTQQTSFEAWLTTIQGLVTEEVAVNLANKNIELQAQIDSMKTEIKQLQYAIGHAILDSTYEN